MKKRITRIYLFVPIALLAGAAFLLFAPSTPFKEEKRILTIPTDSANAEWVFRRIRAENLTGRLWVLRALASLDGYAKKVKPGRYRIDQGTSPWKLYRMLSEGRQEAVRLVVNKFRTKEDFARHAGRLFNFEERELLRLLNSTDSMQRFGLDAESAMTLVIPNTYSIFWNTSPAGLLKRLHVEHDRFWTEKRREKAQALGLTPEQVYSLASIIEEETNYHPEKPIMASVYLNRLREGMPLGADPTIKFALRDFGLRRIMKKHIDAAGSSPYNTYHQKGIPPGPICTPSIKSIDAVLNPEETDYLYFCAKADFSGSHAYAATYEEHKRNAEAYQQALDIRNVK